MKNIKIRLILLLLLVGLIPVIIIWSLSFNSARNSIEEEIFSAMDMYVSTIDRNMIAYMENRFSDSIIMGRTSEIYESLEILRDADWNTEDPRWLEQLSVLEDYTSFVVEKKGINLILITDVEGIVVFTSSRQSEGTNLSNRKYVQEALRGTSSYNDPTLRKYIFPNSFVVSAPIRADGTSFGVVICTINLFIDYDIIGRMLELGESADSYLINADGLILTDTTIGGHNYKAARFNTIDTLAVSILGEQIRNRNHDFIGHAEYENYMGKEVLGTLKVTQFGFDPVGLVVEVESREAFSGLNRALINMLLVGIVTAIIVAIVGIVLADRIAKPLQKVADAMPELLRSFMND
jgi:methyl-accepting chemotaxis protein